MDDALDFLESRPLVGFQMDGSHLHSVLQGILQQQAQQAHLQRGLSQRLAEAEDGLREVSGRQRELSAAMDGVSPGALSALRDRVEDALAEVWRGLDAARRAGDDAGRLGQRVGRELDALREETARDAEERARANAKDCDELGEALRGVERAVAQQERQQAELAREVEGAMGKERAQRLQDALDELSERTDANFRSVEESAKAVDAELARHRGEMHELRNEMGDLDEKMRRGIAGVGRDVDEKTQMILDMLRDYEKSSTELEEHIAAAGEALAKRQSGKQHHRGPSAIRESGRRNGY